jgi:hypothetical protein
MENTLKTYEITLITYRPYTQVVSVEATNSDHAIALALDNVNHNKFNPASVLETCEVEVESVSPDDWDDDDYDDDEEYEEEEEEEVDENYLHA